ncbi:MAG TPA: hypothetical protein V6D26_18030 [Stenomitos sp.]
MTDPLRRLQYLPWRSLLQVSGLTFILVTLVEFFLSLGTLHSPLIRNALSLLFAPPLGILIFVAAAVGVGALAVYLLERLYPQIFINRASLWALIPCLLLFLLLKSLLPIPGLVNLTYPQLLGIIVGVFWKGRPYWR